MTQQGKTTFVALAAIALCVAMADTASAFGRRGGGSGGSWGGNGSNGGSWGSAGSRGSNGSFGGLFSRFRNRGSHGSNGSNGGWGSNGSHGGYVSNGSCGSHGGAYGGERIEVIEEKSTEGEAQAPQARSDSQREVRYYGSSESRSAEMQQSTTGAPPMDQREQAPAINAPQNQRNVQQSGARDTTIERASPSDERFRPGTSGPAPQGP
jgi:hypothetical protein